MLRVPSEGEGIHARVCFVKPSEPAHCSDCTAVAQQGPIVINNILFYMRGVINTSTERQIHEALISLFDMQNIMHFTSIMSIDEKV